MPLNLDNLLGSVTGVIDDLLGDGVGDIVGDLLPGDLLDDLGGTLDDLLGGGSPTGLLEDLLENDLLDLAMLQDILGSVTGDGLDLGVLDGLLDTADLGDLTGTLDDVFDSPLLGILGTVVNSDEVEALSPADLDKVIRFVTSLVGSVAGAAGDTADVESLVNTLLLGDNNLQGDSTANDIDGAEGNDTVDGNDGNDFLLGGDGDDSVNGGNGNDTVNGGDDDDRVFGGAGNDRVLGDDGEDALFGGAGNDRLEGGRGSDRMEGGADNDVYVVNNRGDVVVETSSGGDNDLVRTARDYTLTANVERLSLVGHEDIDGTGNSTANRIDGNDGDNAIDGAGGADTIIGGGGVDRLTGSGGADVFRFDSATESGLGVGRRDVITDFGDGGDKISLRAIDGNLSVDGNQGFKFVGEGDFVASGKGQVGFQVGSGVTLVNFDVDGDGGVDFRVELTGEHSLTASDFLL